MSSYAVCGTLEEPPESLSVCVRVSGPSELSLSGFLLLDSH